MLSLGLPCFCPLADWQASFVPKSSFLGGATLPPTSGKVLWRQSSTTLLGFWCPATCLRKRGGCLHCLYEQVLINFISWVQSVQTAFVSWEVIHAQLPHFSGPLSSNLPLCWSFGKGIIFSQAVHYCEQEEEGQEQQPQFDKWPLVTD